MFWALHFFKAACASDKSGSNLLSTLTFLDGGGSVLSWFNATSISPTSFLDLFLDNKAGLSLGGARLDAIVLGGFGQLIRVGTTLGNSREDEISCGQE